MTEWSWLGYSAHEPLGRQRAWFALRQAAWVRAGPRQSPAEATVRLSRSRSKMSVSIDEKRSQMIGDAAQGHSGYDDAGSSSGTPW